MTQPNIILLMPDQQRLDWLSCAGHPFALTPNIDRLAASGVRFSRASTPYPLCGPARMAMMCGRHPWRQEIWINEDCLDSNTPCFTHGLGRAGYHTVLAGRMHFNGPDQRHGYHERVGHDFCRTYPGGPAMGLGEALSGSASNARRSLETAGAGHNPVLDYDEHVTLAAETFLHNYVATGRQEPLHMTVGWYGPHNPYRAPQALYDAVAADRPADDAPLPLSPDDRAVPWVAKWIAKQKTEGLEDRIAEARIAYAAMVREIDARAGRIIERAKRLHGPTIAVFLSDHGDMMGDHGLTAKGCFYEASMGVPLIIAPLNADGAAWLQARPGSVIDCPVSLLDVAPTLISLGMTDAQRAEAAAAEPGFAFGRHCPIPLPDIDGDDLLPLLRDPDLANEAGWAQRPVFSELNLPFGAPARCVIQGSDKFITYGQDGCEGEQFFDLASDPGEQRNLAASRSERCNELRNLALHDWSVACCEGSRQRKMRDFNYINTWGRTCGNGPEEVFNPGLH